MAKHKRTYPGTIYSPAGSPNLYVAYKGKRYATGLPDTPFNREVCKELLRKFQNEEKQRISTLAGTPPETLLTIFEQYTELRTKNRASNTLRSSRLAFSAIFGDGRTMPTSEVIKAALDTYAQRSTLKAVTYNSYLRHIRSFLTYLKDFGYIDTIPQFKWYLRKEKKRVIQIFTDDEITLLLQYFDKHDREFGNLIRLLCETGLRIAEALALVPGQIYNGRIHLYNKVNGKTESVYISTAAQKILREQQELNHASGTIFRWQPSSNSRLSRTLATAMERCNIEKNGRSFHVFRKTYRGRLLTAGVPPEAVVKLMRHADIKTTMEHYTYISESRLVQAVELMQPIDKLVD